MKVIILAAGKGGRLGDLVKDHPKTLLEFGNETILDRQIRLLKKKGIPVRDIVVAAGYKAEKIREINEIAVIDNYEYASTDNSYSLWLAMQAVRNETLLVLDGDLVFDEEALDTILNAPLDTVVGINANNNFGNTGIVYTSDNIIQEIGKHVSSQVIYAGIMKLSCECAGFLEAQLYDCKKMWYTVALNKILERKSIRMVFSPNRICGINTYSEYLEAKHVFGVENFTIWVTGASGFLGKKIYHVLQRSYHTIGTKATSADKVVDLLDKDAVEAFVKLQKPCVIVNSAGIAEPEKCLENKNTAYKVNVEAVGNLVEVCAAHRIKLIHISTDYVFDGKSGTEYGRNDTRMPCNYYGETKKRAEDQVLEYADSLIVRIPIIYGYNSKLDKEVFPIKVINSLKKREKLYLDNKQVRYPVLIDDVALSIAKALFQTGIVHITSNVSVTKYTWAKIIAKELSADESLIIEDQNSNLGDRPKHVKLKTEQQDYIVTDVKRGTEILRKQLSCVFQLIYKSNPTERIYHFNVGEYRYWLGKKLGESLPVEIKEKADYIVPVPTSGLYYAMGVSETSKIPYLQALVKPDVMTRSFQIADISLRERVIREKIIPIKELLEDKSVVLIDEAIFTGMTLRVVCDAVKACGAKKIYIALPTPECRNLCRQYVQPKRHLLSQDISSCDLAQYFRVDGVFFQKYEDFVDSVKCINGLCMDCFLDDNRNMT